MLPQGKQQTLPCSLTMFNFEGALRCLWQLSGKQRAAGINLSPVLSLLRYILQPPCSKLSKKGRDCTWRGCALIKMQLLTHHFEFLARLTAVDGSNNKQRQQVCCECDSGSRTSFWCSVCKVPLHRDACFFKYHSINASFNWFYPNFSALLGENLVWIAVRLN